MIDRLFSCPSQHAFFCAHLVTSFFELWSYYYHMYSHTYAHFHAHQYTHASIHTNAHAIHRHAGTNARYAQLSVQSARVLRHHGREGEGSGESAAIKSAALEMDSRGSQ